MDFPYKIVIGQRILDAIRCDSECVCHLEAMLGKRLPVSQVSRRTAAERTVTVLNRGGRFQPFNKILSGEQLANKYGKYINLYAEKSYDTKDSMTGKHFTGVTRHFEPGMDSLGNLVSQQDLADGYDLQLITFRTVTQTKSRTPGNY